ncbi:hypothetical protein KY342_05820 [Candidatus Woesearchaeota archaeon]|nr:hypothetical protein [Candidatus Woesearchaeota archaeon]
MDEKLASVVIDEITNLKKKEFKGSRKQDNEDKELNLRISDCHINWLYPAQPNITGIFEVGNARYLAEGSVNLRTKRISFRYHEVDSSKGVDKPIVYYHLYEGNLEKNKNDLYSIKNGTWKKLNSDIEGTFEMTEKSE